MHNCVFIGRCAKQNHTTATTHLGASVRQKNDKSSFFPPPFRLQNQKCIVSGWCVIQSYTTATNLNTTDLSRSSHSLTESKSRSRGKMWVRKLLKLQYIILIEREICGGVSQYWQYFAEAKANFCRDIIITKTMLLSWISMTRICERSQYPSFGCTKELNGLGIKVYLFYGKICNHWSYISQSNPNFLSKTWNI